MLVSHSHQFILVKTKKTAGSSIQTYLKPYCKKGIVEAFFGSHRGASSIQQKVGTAVWNSYLKICPLRNPWDQMVSWYIWEGRDYSLYQKMQRFFQGKEVVSSAKKLSFKEYLLLRKKLDIVNINSDKILIDGQLPDYFYVHYESLKSDMERLCETLNIPFEADKFPHEKGGIRKDKNYQKFYDKETAQIIAEAYANEIELFDYSF